MILAKCGVSIVEIVARLGISVAYPKYQVPQ